MTLVDIGAEPLTRQGKSGLLFVGLGTRPVWTVNVVAVSHSMALVFTLPENRRWELSS
jgi:hypothetical protein